MSNRILTYLENLLGIAQKPFRLISKTKNIYLQISFQSLESVFQTLKPRFQSLELSFKGNAVL